MVDIENIILTRVVVIICCCGVVGNVLNLVTLTRQRLLCNMGTMEKSGITGLVTLALSDLLFCVLNLPNAFVDMKQKTWDTFSFNLIHRVYTQHAVNVFVVSSTWLTVAMAISRYIVVCHPIKARSIVDVKFAVISSVGIFIGSVVVNLPRFWFYRTGCYTDNVSHTAYYSLEAGPLHRTQFGWSVYIVIYFIIALLFPFSSSSSAMSISSGLSGGHDACAVLWSLAVDHLIVT
jgi:hypothetical protein